MATEPQQSPRRPAPAPVELSLSTSRTGGRSVEVAPEFGGARGCRLDFMHPTGRSPLERYCLGRLEAAHRQASRAGARARLLRIIHGAGQRSLAALNEEVPGAESEDASLDEEFRGRGEIGAATVPSSDSLQAAMDEELRIVEAVERAKAALDAEALVALARMRSTADALVAARAAGARVAPVEPDELVAMEVSTATGLAQGEVGVRLELATGAEGRFGRLRDLLASGEVSLRRACQVVEETRHLVDDQIVDGVVEAVFAPTRDGAGLSGGLFRQRLRRAILRADADAEAAAARRRAARRRNGARAQVFDDGTGELTIRNDADKIAAAMDRADAAARAAKAAGDPRSLDQLRADFLTGVAIFGQPRTYAGCGCAEADGPSSSCEGHGRRGADGRCDRPGAVHANGQCERPGGLHANGQCERSGEVPGNAQRCAAVPDWFGSFGQRPPGRVWIVVPVTTALGLDDAPCHLPGYGWVAAEQARAIISAEGSIWQTMLADLDSGHALRLSRKGYRPSRAMVEHVVAVDGTCRGPGCTVPATQCDLDHDLPYPEGATDVSNLSSKHRQHHRVRTAGFWTAVRDPHDATVHWRTTAGRRYVTYPSDWLADVRPRPKFGGYDHNPEPFSRPLGPPGDPDGEKDSGPPPF